METEKTHWKKHNDTRYISGDDLKSCLNGLRPEMQVVIISHKDCDTFDQSKQSKDVKTGLILKDINGNQIYKPLILNKTNSKFLMSEFKSEYIEDWYNKPFTLYALADKRHGYVARCKKYYAPQRISDENAKSQLSKCNSLSELQNIWNILTSEEKSIPTVIKLKDELKEKLK